MAEKLQAYLVIDVQWHVHLRVISDVPHHALGQQTMALNKKTLKLFQDVIRRADVTSSVPKKLAQIKQSVGATEAVKVGAINRAKDSLTTNLAGTTSPSNAPV